MRNKEQSWLLRLNAMCTNRGLTIRNIRLYKNEDTHLYLGGNEERRDADELQVVFVDILLSEHEAVKVVLGKVRCLSVKAVHLTHLPRQSDIRAESLSKTRTVEFLHIKDFHAHLKQPVQENCPHLGLQFRMPLQVTLVMNVLQLLVKHFDPHIVRTSPTGRETASFNHLCWSIPSISTCNRC